ncbi:RICIN domain-containing protein [Clostridium bornimense]
MLDVSESSTANGASVVQWTDNSGYNQQWIFVEVD